MRFLLSLWFLMNVTYLFGFYAGTQATAWWHALPFLGTSLVGVLALGWIRTRNRR